MALWSRVDVYEDLTGAGLWIIDRVDRTFWIGILTVQCLEKLTGVKCFYAGDQFDHSAAGTQIPHVALSSDDWDFVSKNLLDRFGLALITVDGA